MNIDGIYIFMYIYTIFNNCAISPMHWTQKALELKSAPSHTEKM